MRDLVPKFLNDNGLTLGRHNFFILNSIELVSVNSMELTEGGIQLRIDIVGNGSPLTEDTHLHKEAPLEKPDIATMSD